MLHFFVAYSYQYFNFCVGVRVPLQKLLAGLQWHSNAHTATAPQPPQELLAILLLLPLSGTAHTDLAWSLPLLVESKKQVLTFLCKKPCWHFSLQSGHFHNIRISLNVKENFVFQFRVLSFRYEILIEFWVIHFWIKKGTIGHYDCLKPQHDFLFLFLQD